MEVLSKVAPEPGVSESSSHFQPVRSTAEAPVLWSSKKSPSFELELTSVMMMSAWASGVDAASPPKQRAAIWNWSVRCFVVADF